MIDINLLRKKPELVKDSQRRRKEDLEIIDEILEHDKEWRTLVQKRDSLSHEKNEVSEEIAKLKKEDKPAEEKIEEMQDLTDKIEEIEEEAEEKKQKRDELLSRVPNLLHESVPPGEDESDNKEIRKEGNLPDFDFEPKGHVNLGKNLNLFDIKSAAKTSGARFYYMTGKGAALELALTNYAFEKLNEKGFEPMLPPHMVREKVMHGAGMLPMSRDEIYKIEDEDLYLILTSEHAIAGLHMDEILDAEDLPERYVGFSPCYRTEAGTHGKDTKGIFRVHQFNKVEMFTFSEPGDSWKEHEFLLECAEDLVKGLKLPYRVVNVCTGDIGNTAAKKYDIEAWMPAQDRYREIISCANCTDYQARRLNCRYRIKQNDKPKPVHTLNSTGLAMSRTIVAILENYQQPDGSVKVPEVLQKYTGFKKIEPKKEGP